MKYTCMINQELYGNPSRLTSYEVEGCWSLDFVEEKKMLLARCSCNSRNMANRREEDQL